MAPTQAPIRTDVTSIDRLLQAITDGRGDSVAGLYSADAQLDATVPGWRFRCRGGDAIAAEYASWFADAGQFEELERTSIAGGEVVTYLLTWVEHGVPHAAHHCHQLLLDASGLITFDRVFCGGRWDAGLLARMDEAEHAG